MFHGFGLATNFAPDNIAFGKLPEGLKRFLFSPFGGKVLAKILMYHYVPKTLLLSELIHTEKHHHHKDLNVAVFEDDDKSFKKEVEVPTALPNTTLKVTIDKSKVPLLDGQCSRGTAPVSYADSVGVYKTVVKVNGNYVKVFDVPAHNGATHVRSPLPQCQLPTFDADLLPQVIGDVLIPPHKHHDHHGEDIASTDSWQNWEDWLPAWASEA